MSDHVLMDVCLEGGREGIEVAGGFERYATQQLFSSLATLTTLLSSASMNVYQERQCCPSRFIVIGSPTPYRRSHSINTDGRRGGATGCGRGCHSEVAGGDARCHHQETKNVLAIHCGT